MILILAYLLLLHQSDPTFDVNEFSYDSQEKSRCILEPTWDQPWKTRTCTT